MTVREMLTLLVSCTLFLTGLSGGVGFLLGKFLPAYYRTVFLNGQDEGFDPLAVGIGQGLTQGITAGAVVGVLLVVALTWYRAKTFVAKGGTA